MFIDSHCHLTFPELSSQLPQILDAMAQAQVHQALCICTTMEEFDAVQGLVAQQPQLWASVGVHPDNEGVREPSVAELVAGSQRPKVVAIGETGLDYYQMDERKGGRTVADMAWQRERFRTHIRAAQETGLPLVIHTRESSDDTVAILKEGGGGLSGVFHCFTETEQVARAALDLGFYISFSGILTFKSATALRALATFVPEDRLLIETDSPYLAPAPHRGKTNNPSYVPFVARQLAELRGCPIETIAAQTSANFHRLFARTQPVNT
ncbi:MAG: TatD family deoxyribonuclease [Betaproteobacteria bacterium]|nr:TatD family deoxyribonuclease [Betaproteobacteria bacterium]